MTHITGKLTSYLAALLVLVGPGMLFAASKTNVVQHSIVVHFADLDLNRPSDVAKLYHRIRFAADSTCGPRQLTGTYTTSVGYLNCFATAVDQAVARLDLPALNVYHQQQRSLASERTATLARQ